MTKTEFKSPTSDHRSLLTQQTTTLSPNKLLETTIDVNTNPEGKKSVFCSNHFFYHGMPNH